MQRVEVNPRHRCDTGVVEQSTTPLVRLLAEMAEVGIYIECGIGLRKTINSHLVQSVQYDIPFAPIHFDVGLQRRVGECVQRSVLGWAGGHSDILPMRASMASSKPAGASIHPSRHPVIHQNFEKLLMTIGFVLNSHAECDGSPKLTPW